jgi:hypothetical protein
MYKKNWPNPLNKIYLRCKVIALLRSADRHRSVNLIGSIGATALLEMPRSTPQRHSCWHYRHCPVKPIGGTGIIAPFGLIQPVHSSAPVRDTKGLEILMENLL